MQLNTWPAHPHWQLTRTNIHTAGGLLRFGENKSFMRETWEPLSVKTVRTQVSGFKGVFQVALSPGQVVKQMTFSNGITALHCKGWCFSKAPQGSFFSVVFNGLVAAGACLQLTILALQRVPSWTCLNFSMWKYLFKQAPRCTSTTLCGTYLQAVVEEVLRSFL